jgi:hypothetical protein
MTIDYVMQCVPIDLTLQNPDFLQAWKRWVAHRLALKGGTIQTFEEHMKYCARVTSPVAIKHINTSISAGWRAIYAPKNNDTKSTKPRTCI